MTEDDAIERLRIVAMLMLSLVLLPMALKRFVKTPVTEES
jgi:hypothetical protein